MNEDKGADGTPTFDSDDQAWMETLLPDGAIPTGLFSVINFIRPHDGKTCYRIYTPCDEAINVTVGSAFLGILETIARSGIDIGFAYKDPDE